MPKRVLSVIANIFTLGAYGRDLELRQAKRKLSVIDDVLGIRLSEESGRTVVTFSRDVIFRFEGNLAISGEKFVAIESGWKKSNDFYKLDLNPKSDLLSVFNGDRESVPIEVQESSINIQTQGESCTCHTLLEKAISAPGTDVGDPDKTTRALQT